MQVYNYPVRKVSFGALNYKRLNNMSIPDDLKVRLALDTGGADCFITSKMINGQHYSLSMTDDRKTEIGHCLFDLTDTNTFHLSTINNYSERFKGVGSVLHLAEIISMLENGVDRIKLYSLGSAINFHAKLGFKPSIKTKSETTSFLINEIAMKHNTERFSGVMRRVTEWFKDKQSSDSEKLESGNQIVDEFIQTINRDRLKYYTDYNIISGINMSLERVNVLNNRGHYNELFEKYGIDYKITD